MGVNIKVDHSKFEKTAKAIEEYKKLVHDKTMQMDLTIKQVGLAFGGKDGVEFIKQWNQLLAKDSAYDKMLKLLQSYADFLRYAAQEYKAAQRRAIDRI